MNERVKKFSLKRTSNVHDDSFTYGTVYPVYRCTTAHPIYKFYILDDTCSKQYFNTLNGHIDRESWLHPDNWKVIRHNKEEKEMNEKVFKAGDKIRFKNDWCDVTAGKEYELINVDNFLMFIDDVGDRLRFYDLTNRCRTGIAAYTELMEEEQTMTKDFIGLKVGDKITCDSDKLPYWVKGKEYEVLENTTDIYPFYPFYIIDEEGDRHWFCVEENGNPTYPGLNDIFSWNKSEVEEEQKTDQVNNSKVAFVKADITELLAAIEKDEQDKYYIYDSKKGTIKPLVSETNLHQLLNYQILRKEEK